MHSTVFNGLYNVTASSSLSFSFFPFLTAILNVICYCTSYEILFGGLPSIVSKRDTFNHNVLWRRIIDSKLNHYSVRCVQNPY